MRFLRYLAVLGILLLPAAAVSHAQVSVGVGIGGPVYGGYYGYPAPVCAYGYYGYYPYACAPYGYYGPSWFSRWPLYRRRPLVPRLYGYRGYLATAAGTMDGLSMDARLRLWTYPVTVMDGRFRTVAVIAAERLEAASPVVLFTVTSVAAASMAVDERWRIPRWRWRPRWWRHR